MLAKDNQNYKINKHILMIIKLVMAFSLSISILGVSVFYWSFNESFYLSEHEKNNVARELNISQVELENVTHNLINYLKGIDSSLNVKIVSRMYNLYDNKDTINISKGSEYFYNQRGIMHMKDVKELFKIGFIILIAMIVVCVVSAFIIFRLGRWLGIAKSLVYSFWFTLIISIFVLIVSVIDFTNSFIYFHYLIFDNELWFLDPATSRLIVMLPEQFFQKIATNILSVWIAFTLILSAVGKMIIS